MNNAGRSYGRSSSFQVTLFTYGLFTILLISCAASLTTLFSHDSSQPDRAWLDLETQRFIENGGCTPVIAEQLIIVPVTHAPFAWRQLGTAYQLLPHADTQQRYAVNSVHCGGIEMLIAVNVEQAMLQRDKQIILISIDVLVILVLMLVMYAIGRFVVDGTNRISSTAQTIMATGDLSRRIQVESRWDDLSYSAATINDLLARIEALMQGVKRVSDNIAHDLRTPLTRIRNDLDDLRDKAPDAELDIVVAEVDQLIRTFNSLLRISRIETEQQRSHFQHVNVGELLDDVSQFYQPLAEDKDIVLSTDLTGAVILGDRDLLFQAFANVLDNALKYTPEKGTIAISLTLVVKGGCIVKIADSGSGIPAQFHSKLTQRFFRVDPSRHPEGTGLGLSLVNAVISLHRGSIRFSDNQPGLVVELTLPLIKAEVEHS